MSKFFSELTVLSQKEVSPGLFLASLELPKDTVDHAAGERESARRNETESLFAPGSFLMLRCEPSEPYRLMRPMSVLGYEDGSSRVDILYRVVGDQTRKLSFAPPGIRLPALFPLGNRFAMPPDAGTPTIMVAGGVGLPPLLFLARHLQREFFPRPAFFIGAKDDSQLPMAFLDRCPADFHFATDDGSYGFHGNVVELLASEGIPEAAWVYACGPRAMLQALQKLIKQHPPASCQASLEEMMACGTGACYGCAVGFHGEGVDAKRLVCRDGAVFELAQIRFAENGRTL